MVADLSTFIPDCPTSTYNSSLNLDIPDGVGIEPELEIDESGFTYWVIASGANTKQETSDVIDIAKYFYDCMRKYQWLCHMMNMVKHGIYGFDKQNIINATEKSTYQIVSVGSSSIQLKWEAGEPDPRLIPSAGYRTPSTQAILHVDHESCLYGHGGWLIKNYDFSGLAPTATSGNFTVRLHTPIGGLVDDLNPLDPFTGTGDGVPSATIEFYIMREPWTAPRDIYPLWCVSKTIIIPYYDNTEYVLEDAKRIACPDTINFKAEHRDSEDDPWIDFTSTVIEKVKIDHTGGGGYETKIDPLGWGVADAKDIRIRYWVEDGTTEAFYGGQDRCKHSTPDYSKTYGVDGGIETSATHYCAKAATASHANEYQEQCYMCNVCSE